MGGLTTQVIQQTLKPNSHSWLEHPVKPKNRTPKPPKLQTHEKALVLINAKPATTYKLIKQLQTIEGVSEAYPSRGLYDAVAIVEAQSLEELKSLVFERIHSLGSIQATLTLTLVNKNC
jgi:DNA-binding Lrp family transcriptional regulator